MSRVALARASMLALLLAPACTTEAVDLLPDDAAISDLATQDAELGLDARPDANESADAMQLDAAAADSGSACVCRFSCTIDAECVRAIGAASVCGGGICSGSAGTCSSNLDCLSGFACFGDETGTNPCP